MELKHLRTFLALCEIRNFTKTAAHLHYAQSYVTTQIRQLEEELGVRLFERLGKTIAITEDGSSLVPYARQMLRTYEEMEHRFQNRKKGRITVGAAESICLGRLPPAVVAFQQGHPDIEFHLKVLDTDDFSPLLLSGSIDLALILDTAFHHPSLTTALQMNEPISAFAAPGHPLIKKNTVSPAEFAGMPLLLTGKGCAYRKVFEGTLLEAGVSPKIVLETGSIQVLIQMARSGLGICVLPVSAVSEELRNGGLLPISCRLQFDVMFQLIYHKDKWMPEHLKDFIETVKNSVGMETVSGLRQRKNRNDSNCHSGLTLS